MRNRQDMKMQEKTMKLFSLNFNQLNRFKHGRFN